MRQKQKLILTGTTGTGKSWVACAFGQQACRQELLTLYMTATRLFENLTVGLAEGSLPKLRRQLVSASLLIIDDVGIDGADSTRADSLGNTGSTIDGLILDPYQSISNQ